MEIFTPAELRSLTRTLSSSPVCCTGTTPTGAPLTLRSRYNVASMAETVSPNVVTVGSGGAVPPNAAWHRSNQLPQLHRKAHARQPRPSMVTHRAASPAAHSLPAAPAIGDRTPPRPASASA